MIHNAELLCPEIDRAEQLLRQAENTNLSPYERYQALTQLLPYGTLLKVNHIDRLGRVLFDPFLWKRASTGPAFVVGVEGEYVGETRQVRKSVCVGQISTPMSIHELEIVTSISECGAQIQIVKLLYMATEISAQQRAEYWIRKVFDPYRMHYGVGNDGAFCGGYSLYRLDDLLCLIIGTTCQDQPYALEVYKLMCRSHNSSEVVTALNGLGKVGTERKDWKFALPMVCFFVNSHPCWYVGAAQAFCDLHSALSQETAPWWIAEAHGIARVLASFSTQMSNAASETQIAPLRNRAQKLLEKLKEEYRSDDGVLRLLE